MDPDAVADQTTFPASAGVSVGINGPNVGGMIHVDTHARLFTLCGRSTLFTMPLRAPLGRLVQLDPPPCTVHRSNVCAAGRPVECLDRSADSDRVSWGISRLWRNNLAGSNSVRGGS